MIAWRAEQKDKRAYVINDMKSFKPFYFYHLENKEKVYK